MRKITDLRGIKDTAKVFLHMNIEETKFSPLVIKHPFTDSAMVCLSQTDGEIAFANIMEDTKAFTLWKEQVEKQIDTAEDVFGVYHLVPERNPAAKPFLRSKNTDLMTKSYLLAFLKYAEPYLSREDFSKMLADIWIRTEAPNLDPNFKQKELLDLFRKSKHVECVCLLYTSQQQAQKNGDETAFEERCQAITAQIEVLEMKQIKAASRGENGRKMEDIENFLDKTNCILTEYDDKLVRQLIQNINVVNASKIEVVFKSGITVEASLRQENEIGEACV